MAITNRYEGLPETQIHDLLRNERRRQVIKHLQETVGSTTLRDLAETIAEHECGQSPPPKDVRDSVYNSLHQTHLPKLDRNGIVEYDSNRKTIRLTENARSVDVYMDIVTAYGITWSEFYQLFGTGSLLLLLGAHLDTPLLSAIDPILLISLFLAGYAISIGYQMWTQRWMYLNALFG